MRKEDNFLSPTAAAEKSILVHDGGDDDGEYDSDAISDTCLEFFGSFYMLWNSLALSYHFEIQIFSTGDALDYLAVWTEPLKPMKLYAWAMLMRVPTWQDIEAVMNNLSENKLFDASEKATKVHAQFRLVKIYCTDEKIKDWKNRHIPTVDRWVEIFRNLDSEDREYGEIATVVEYILCLPGTSASVERVFSAVNKTWTDEKSQLQVETLKAILTVKCNLKLSCIEFFKFLKEKPELLRQIASKDKYRTDTESGETIMIDNDTERDEKENEPLN